MVASDRGYRHDRRRRRGPRPHFRQIGPDEGDEPGHVGGPAFGGPTARVADVVEMHPVDGVASGELEHEPPELGPHRGQFGIEEPPLSHEARPVELAAGQLAHRAARASDEPVGVAVPDVVGVGRRVGGGPRQKRVHPRMDLDAAGVGLGERLGQWVLPAPRGRGRRHEHVARIQGVPAPGDLQVHAPAAGALDGRQGACPRGGALQRVPDDPHDAWKGAGWRLGGERILRSHHGRSRAGRFRGRNQGPPGHGQESQRDTGAAAAQQLDVSTPYSYILGLPQNLSRSRRRCRTTTCTSFIRSWTPRTSAYS